MNIQAEKIEIIRLLLNTKKTSILAKIKRVFEHETGEDFYDSLTEAQRASIKRGLLQIEKGKVVSHQEVRKIYEKWL